MFPYIHGFRSILLSTESVGGQGLLRAKEHSGLLAESSGMAVSSRLLTHCLILQFQVLSTRLYLNPVIIDCGRCSKMWRIPSFSLY